MQDIRQETLNECTRAEQSARVELWEIDLTEVGGERYFFCNEQNEKGEPVTCTRVGWFSCLRLVERCELNRLTW